MTARRVYRIQKSNSPRIGRWLKWAKQRYLQARCAVFFALALSLQAASLPWTKQSTSYKTGSAGNYNSFQVVGSTVTFWNNLGKSTAGKLYRGTGNLTKISSWSVVIPQGPEYELQWLRTPAVSKGAAGTQTDYWLIQEATRCYACGAPRYEKVAYSSPDGIHWTFQGIVMLDGAKMPSWDGSMALVYDASKPYALDTQNLGNNRFVYILTTPSPKVCISYDGVNFVSFPLAWPIAGDKPVFASLARTPYGWHILAGDKWGTNGVTYLRHIYSPDLRAWKVLESNSPVKSKYGYKSGNLYFDAARNRLWAFGPSGSASVGGNLFWLTARSF